MPRAESVERVLVWALLASILVLGVALRVKDPFATDSLAAEDPYTHVVFTKEWSEQGYFADSFHLGTAMYPPGMHAWFAAFAPFTGMPLTELARILPPFMGGLAVLGMFALGSRLSGPVAGLGAAFVAATMPEHVFRSELFFPTTFDLMLIPFWLLAFHLAMTTHRIAGTVLFLGASVPLAIMHPWAVPLMAAGLAVYALLRVKRGAWDRTDLRWAAGMLVPAIAFAMAFRWDTSDTGFADFFASLPGLAWTGDLALPGPLLFLILVPVLGSIAFVAAWIVERAPALPRVVGIVLGIALLASLPLLTRTPQPDVYYPHMLGRLITWLSFAGFLMAVVRPNAVGDLGLAITVTLFPLTAINFFDSEFWPARTVVYLTMGLALLGGSLASGVHELPLKLPRLSRGGAAPRVAVLLVLALAVAGSAAAFPTHPYKWYRMYNASDYEGLQEASAVLDQDATSRVFIYTWQPALLVKALTDPDHVWYGSKFFNNETARETYIPKVEGHAYVLVDKHTVKAGKAGKVELGFLQDPRYQPVVRSEGDGIILYEVAK